MIAEISDTVLHSHILLDDKNLSSEKNKIIQYDSSQHLFKFRESAIYAATKSIALDLGYEYRYRVVRPGFAKEDFCIDDYGQEYESRFEKAFHIDISERIDEIPESIQLCGFI